MEGRTALGDCGAIETKSHICRLVKGRYPGRQQKRKSGRKTVKTSIEVDPVANAVSVTLGLRHEEQAFEVPARLFE